jgi:hypothetical protein
LYHCKKNDGEECLFLYQCEKNDGLVFYFLYPLVILFLSVLVSIIAFLLALLLSVIALLFSVTVIAFLLDLCYFLLYNTRVLNIVEMSSSTSIESFEGSLPNDGDKCLNIVNSTIVSILEFT